MERSDVLIIGSGMAGLTAGALLAKKGLKVRVVEQNWQPGGCTSAYWRKGFVFETGATTLVGMGEDMPLQYVLDKGTFNECLNNLMKLINIIILIGQ